ncbi:S-layer homology domain-containing protein [Paenibacillus sp. TC-CSREp1]|uniref:S-layer homology domain-containing protein n=1 Tax=Paenibacillus sp. TC-CSREp1 TaxID=3410089 RepID=UPI003CF4B877
MKLKRWLSAMLAAQFLLGNALIWGEGTANASLVTGGNTGSTHFTAESSRSNEKNESFQRTASVQSSPPETINETETRTVLPKPKVTVTSTDNSITITWDEVPGAVNYGLLINRDSRGFIPERSYTITRATPGYTYRISVFGYDGTNYGEQELLFVRLKEPEPVYDDAGRIDFTGKLSGQLDQVIQEGFTFVNWGLVNASSMSLFYKFNGIEQAEVYVNDVKSTELKNNTSSSARISGLKPGEKNIIRLAWASHANPTQTDSLEFIVTPPAVDAYTLGDSKAAFGSVVDLKQFGKWYLVDNQTLISQNTVSKYIDIQGETAVWRVESYSNINPDSLGYEMVKMRADKLTPFHLLSWTANAYDNGEYNYSFSSPMGIVTKDDMEKYTGIVLSDPKDANRMVSSLALADPSTYESAFGKSGNQGVAFSETASDPLTFPGGHMSNVAAGTLQNFKYKAILKYNGEYKGQGTDEDPYVIPTLANGEPVPPKVVLEKPGYFEAKVVGNDLYLAWKSVEGAEEYVLKRDAEIIYEGPLLEFLDVGVNINSGHKYTIVARKGDVYGEEKEHKVANTIHLSYPADFQVEALDSTKVRLSWRAVDQAEEYVITRNDLPLAVIKSTTYEDVNLTPDSTYTYKVIAKNGNNESPPAVQKVKMPKVTEDVAPKGQIKLRVNRIYDDKIDLQWNMVEGATQYEVYQDRVNKVWSGHSNTMIAYTLQPGRTYTYHIVASNKYGKIESGILEVQTAGVPVPMNVSPVNAPNATIAFDYQPIEGAIHYVERNPQTKYVPLGNGVYRKTYLNTATGETRDEGMVTAVNGRLQFSETGVEPNKYYEYNIIAVRVKPDGSEEVIGKQTVAVTTPPDGRGATVYGNNYDVPPYYNPYYNPYAYPYPYQVPYSNSSTTSGKSESVTIDTQILPSNKGNQGPDVGFADIATSYAKDAILELAQKGIVKGYSDGTFGANEKVTRAEFAIFLTRALEYNTNVPYINEFTDVQTNSWYYNEIMPSLQHGILKGFSDGTLRPNANVTREQASSMIENVMKKQGYVLSSFILYEDNAMFSNWARNSIHLVTQESVMKGYPDRKFMPKKQLTRQEAAMIIYNLMKKIR